MKAYLKFDYTILTKKILEEKLTELNLDFSITGFGEIEFENTITPLKLSKISKSLSEYGIEIIESQKNILIQKIKDTIVKMVNSEEPITVKSSIYLSEKLNLSYGFLSNLFSEVTFTSIENYIILQKIELAKNLIIKEELTLTEIAYKLNYSSVAHLSTQFKKITGITPSLFQRIISKRRANLTKNNI
ncbi:MAG: helix-turn-helix domain-containing protein [Flavobacterium sp.]